MSDSQWTVFDKLELLRLAHQLGNVSEACKRIGLSRDSYYRIRKLFNEKGKAGLARSSRAGQLMDAELAAIDTAIGNGSHKSAMGDRTFDATVTVGRGRPPRQIKTAQQTRRMKKTLQGPKRSIKNRREAALDAARDEIDTRFPGSGSEAVLLDAAFTLFAEQNFATVTIKDISRRVGMNTSLIYYYFGSKEGLFLRVVESAAEHAFNSFVNIRDENASPRDVLRLWIENHVRQFPLMRDLIKISIDYANTRNRLPNIDLAIRKFYDMERDLLQATILRGMESGEFREVSVAKMSMFVSTFLDGMLVRSVMIGDFRPADATATLYEVVLSHLSRQKRVKSKFSRVKELSALQFSLRTDERHRDAPK